MSMTPSQRFPNGIVPLQGSSSKKKAVEMSGPCKAWNGELSHPSHCPLEDADNAGVSHIATAIDGGHRVSKTKTY
jgi:hypothetical protein